MWTHDDGSRSLGDPAAVDVPELLTRQGGVVTYAQALAAGVSARQLRSGGTLVRIRQGVYAERSRVASSTSADAVALQVAAVRLTTSVDLVAAGVTAARVHGLPVLGRSLGLHLVERKELRPRHRGRSAPVADSEVCLVRGVPVTGLARTATDVARRTGFAGGVITADGALRAGLGPAELLEAVEAARGWPGARRARRAAAFADARAESPLESLGRVRMEEGGLPRPELQVVLGDAHGPIARVDHYWPAHRTIAEADGALKYTEVAGLFAEKRREDRLREAGFEVVRYTWDEALGRPDVVIARLLAAFARAARRAA